MKEMLKRAFVLLLILLFLVGCGQDNSAETALIEEKEELLIKKEDYLKEKEEELKSREDLLDERESELNERELEISENVSDEGDSEAATTEGQKVTETNKYQKETETKSSSSLKDYDSKEVEYARILMMTNEVDPSATVIHVYNEPAGSPVSIYSEASAKFPYDVTHLYGDFSAQGYLTYSSHGDGYITIYPVPSHWHQEDQSDEGYRKYTQEILDNAQKIYVQPFNNQDVIDKIESVEFVYD